MNKRTFIISSNIWGGWRTIIDINLCNSLEDIVDNVVNKLDSTLKNNNFEELHHKLVNKHNQMHIHNHTFDQIKNSIDTDMFFVCDHC